MKKLLLIALSVSALSATLSGCGGSGSSTSFPGDWTGTFTSVETSCPFSVALAPTMNELYPMTIAIDENNVFEVVSALGDMASGTQGEGETNSFTARSDIFGDYGSILPYTCTSKARVGYLGVEDNESSVIIVYSFTNCNSPDNPEQNFECSATYSGTATRVDLVAD